MLKFIERVWTVRRDGARREERAETIRQCEANTAAVVNLVHFHLNLPSIVQLALEKYICAHLLAETKFAAESTNYLDTAQAMYVADTGFSHAELAKLSAAISSVALEAQHQGKIHELPARLLHELVPYIF